MVCPCRSVLSFHVRVHSYFLSSYVLLPENGPASVPQLDAHPVEDGGIVIVGQTVGHDQAKVGLELVKRVVSELFHLYKIISELGTLYQGLGSGLAKNQIRGSAPQTEADF